jgi:hypothetical protein
MADYTRLQVGRAAAILTTGEVAGTALRLDQTHGANVTVQLGFTLGSLTNGIVRFYVSMDGTTYYPLASGATVLTETLEADATRAYVMPPLHGWKFFRASVQGTGTVTNSSANYTYRWLRRGSQI